MIGSSFLPPLSDDCVYADECSREDALGYSQQLKRNKPEKTHSRISRALLTGLSANP
jgi:hypothetical protein